MRGLDGHLAYHPVLKEGQVVWQKGLTVLRGKAISRPVSACHDESSAVRDKSLTRSQVHGRTRQTRTLA
eukprot:763318-Hanusia_phi.AAC.16